MRCLRRKTVFLSLQFASTYNNNQNFKPTNDPTKNMCGKAKEITSTTSKGQSTKQLLDNILEVTQVAMNGDGQAKNNNGDGQVMNDTGEFGELGGYSRHILLISFVSL